MSAEDAELRARELLEEQSQSREPSEDEIAQIRNSMLTELAMERLRAIAKGEDPQPGDKAEGESEPADDESETADTDGETADADNA